jgi:hypothetical protein
MAEKRSNHVIHHLSVSGWSAKRSGLLHEKRVKELDYSDGWDQKIGYSPINFFPSQYCFNNIDSNTNPQRDITISLLLPDQGSMDPSK